MKARASSQSWSDGIYTSSMYILVGLFPACVPIPFEQTFCVQFQGGCSPQCNHNQAFILLQLCTSFLSHSGGRFA
eukprot:scaffold53541_cov19-Tisochrysis_lutea.AAC.2